MPWHPDLPDLPIEKPKIIEDLEQADHAFLNSMPSAEVDETIESVAYNVAKAYKKKFPNGNPEDCFNFITIALNVTGSALGENVGTAMIAQSSEVAEKVCHMFYSED